MTDIVKRLRACVPCDEYEHVKCDAIFTEAADEIERLRRADKLARQFSSVGLIGALEAENGRLREILRIIWVAYQDNDGIRKIFHEAGFPWPESERVWTP